MNDYQAFLEAFKDYLDGTEAGIVKLQRELKQIMGDKKPKAEVPFNPDKIAWKDRQGGKGPFQISEDMADPEHVALLDFVQFAGGTLFHEGYFYWLMVDQQAVGRKQIKKGEATK